MRPHLALLLPLALAATACAPPPPTSSGPAALQVCRSCVQADMERLAGAAARGRQCGTRDEAQAARFIQGRLEAAGARGAFARGGYLQSVMLSTPTLQGAPTLEISGGPAPIRWTGGVEFIALARPATVSGPLLRVADAGEATTAQVSGAVVFLEAGKASPAERRALAAKGAVAVIAPASPRVLKAWSGVADIWRETEVRDAPGNPPDDTAPYLVLQPAAADALKKIQNGSRLRLTASFAAPKVRNTKNVVGVIHGTAPDADQRAVLLSAHYDHLGVRNGVLYPGADDDASGTAAVLEFARLLGKCTPPKRTVYFALFGCEEEGGLGARYFREHFPTRLSDLSANLEFEMIGLRDPKHPDELMLTGWEKSNLGPALRDHGARLGPDPYPEENFFQRSDNYQLALNGVVAQTVGGWPLPPSYHQPTDDLAHVDIGFMTEVIQSMAGPIQWLVGSDFTPEWNPGQKP